MLRVAIVGTGAIADSHIEAYLKFTRRCQVVALVDIYPQKAVQKIEKYGLEAATYAGVPQLLAGVDFDLASVCLPPFAHASVAVDLLKAGKHVLIEKPMATCLEECDQMIAAAQSTGSLLSVVAQNRFKTPMMKLKKLLESGVIGKVVHGQVDSFWWRGQNYYDLWWRGTWEKEGGGCTMNHAVHHIDLFHWMMGMPAELQAVMANSFHNNSEVEDFSSAVLLYENGSLGQITASLLHHGEEQQLAIQGERAMLAVPWKLRAFQQKENGFPEDNPELVAEIQALYDQLPELAHSGHAGQIANVLAAIAGEETLLVDGLAGRNTIELVTAIYLSSTLGKRVKLPLTPQDPFYTRAGILAAVPHFHEKTRSVENFANAEIIVGSVNEGKG